MLLKDNISRKMETFFMVQWLWIQVTPKGALIQILSLFQKKKRKEIGEF